MWPLVSDNQIENFKKKTELGRALLCLSEKKKKSQKRQSQKNNGKPLKGSQDN